MVSFGHAETDRDVFSRNDAYHCGLLCAGACTYVLWMNFLRYTGSLAILLIPAVLAIAAEYLDRNRSPVRVALWLFGAMYSLIAIDTVMAVCKAGLRWLQVPLALVSAAAWPLCLSDCQPQCSQCLAGRPKRIFRRDEVVRLRDQEGLSWRAIGKQLGIPAITALDSYRTGCTETVPVEVAVSDGKRKRKTAAA